MAPNTEGACDPCNPCGSGGPPEPVNKCQEPPQQKWPPGGPGKPCQCKTKKMKYIQPEVRASFKPSNVYRKSDHIFAQDTVQKLSYPGVDKETAKLCRQGTFKPVGNFAFSNQPLADETTFRLSYTGVGGEPAVPFKPTRRNMMGAGPMQSLTTFRHDYGPKISERLGQVVPEGNIRLSTAKMEDLTTMLASYQPTGEVDQIPSFKPINVYRKPTHKLEQDTIQKLSYQPWVPTPKEEYPWAKKPGYAQPTHKMEDLTVYRGSFYGTNGEKTEPILPPKGRNCITECKLFSGKTVYNESYLPSDCKAGDCKMPQIIPEGNFRFSTEPLSAETTFRNSYTGVGGEPAVPYKPTRRNMMGAGPMQSLTTFRHDYTAKPSEKLAQIRPENNFRLSDAKMEDLTTMLASYQPVTADKVENFKPINLYKPPTHNLESDTIQKLSYQPWAPTPKEEFPWAKKPPYVQPTSRLEGNTIYRNSYFAPGNFIEDPSQEAGPDPCCCCRWQGECLTATEDLGQR